MFQWFLAASASAAAAAFFASALLMGGPYGLGSICASIPSAQNASARTKTDKIFRMYRDIVACSSSHVMNAPGRVEGWESKAGRSGCQPSVLHLDCRLRIAGFIESESYRRQTPDATD